MERPRVDSQEGCSVQVTIHCAYHLPQMSHVHFGSVSLDGSVHAYVEVFVVHTVNGREKMRKIHSAEDFGCPIVKSRNPTWEYSVEHTLTIPQLTAIRVQVWDHHRVRASKLVGEVDIENAELPSSNGNQTYMLELPTSKKLDGEKIAAINVSVTINGTLPRGDSISE